MEWDVENVYQYQNNEKKKRKEKNHHHQPVGLIYKTKKTKLMSSNQKFLFFKKNAEGINFIPFIQLPAFYHQQPHS